MKKTDLIHKLKQLAGISDEERAYLINLVNTKKKYGLVWEDKPEDVEEQLRHNLPVLKEVTEKRILGKAIAKKVDEPQTQPQTQTLFNNQRNPEIPPISGSDNYPNHILIEGDNLHALTALTFTHEGKIDVIYIDPPYNTGSNDFRYNDNYVDKDDEFRHSKWLSFIDKRLKIAKLLLKSKGVIFMSINEEEFCQLKILCDDIFGLNNYLTTFTIKVRHENRILKGDKDFHEVTEFLLLYRNSSDFKTVKRIEDNTSNDLYIYRIEELIENPESIRLDNKEVKVFRQGQYKIFKTNPDSKSLKKISVRGSIKEGNSSGRFFMKHFANNIGKEFSTLYRVPDMGDDELPYRYFLMPENSKRVNGDYFQGVPMNRSDKKMVPYPNYFDFVDEFNNVGYEGGIEFRNGKKPISFLKKVFEIAGLKSGKILDFFAGSGTTLHATMQLNAEDGGNRQCILVTNNENNICEEVTYERNKRVIEGYTNSKGEKVDGLTNNNLRYYKSEFVGREPSIKNKKEITHLATELLCIKEDIYTEQMQIGDYQLNARNVRCFQQGHLYLLVIYDEEVIEQMVELIQHVVVADAERKTQFKIYVFSNGQYPYTEEFEEVLPYITLCALPDAIYKAYQNVLPKRQRPQVPELEEPTAEDVENQLINEEVNLFNQR